jgi:hypothetical protein
MWFKAVVPVLALAALAACSSSASDTGTQASESPTGARRSATANPSGTMTAKNTPNAQIESSAPRDGLTGYGATVSAWQSVHGTSVSGYTKGTVYGPVVRDGTHRYFGVQADARITMYERAFPRTTSLAEARRIVLEDFPSDAKITVKDTDQVACEIDLIESAKVKKATGSNAIAAFFSDPDPGGDINAPMDRGDVASANLMPAFNDGKKNLGDC